jgi:hypothetical protein
MLIWKAVTLRLTQNRLSFGKVSLRSSFAIRAECRPSGPLVNSQRVNITPSATPHSSQWGKRSRTQATSLEQPLIKRTRVNYSHSGSTSSSSSMPSAMSSPLASSGFTPIQVTPIASSFSSGGTVSQSVSSNTTVPPPPRKRKKQRACISSIKVEDPDRGALISAAIREYCAYLAAADPYPEGSKPLTMAMQAWGRANDRNRPGLPHLAIDDHAETAVRFTIHLYVVLTLSLDQGSRCDFPKRDQQGCQTSHCRNLRVTTTRKP